MSDLQKDDVDGGHVFALCRGHNVLVTLLVVNLWRQLIQDARRKLHNLIINDKTFYET